jgi:uncharacterized membrane protein
MLPHPAILEAYEKIRKGITDDFVDMAKSILAHDHDVEKAQIEAQKRAIVPELGRKPTCFLTGELSDG